MNNSKHQYFRPVWTSGRYDKKSHSAIIYNLASGKSYFFEDTAADVIDYMLIADRNEKIDICKIVNELANAGAEAISINDVRILSSTEIAQPDGVLMIINGQRVSSPYVIKAIGNQTYLSSTLSLKDSGYIDKTRAIGLNVKLETGKNIKILKYNGDMNIKYMKEGENK